MANKPKHLKPANDVPVVDLLLKCGAENTQHKLDALQIKYDASVPAHEAVGMLKRGHISRAFDNLVDVYTLYQIKKNKDYLIVGNWAFFCKKAGYAVRTVDDWLADIGILPEIFSAAIAESFGVTFQQIRLLGRGISAGSAEIKDGQLFVLGEPCTPENAQFKIDKLEKALQASKNELKVAQGHNRDKDALLAKKNEQIARYTGEANSKNLSPEEDAVLNFLAKQKRRFDDLAKPLEPGEFKALLSYGKRDENGARLPSDVTPRMRTAYIGFWESLRKQCNAAAVEADDMYGTGLDDKDKKPEWMTEGWKQRDKV